MNTKRNNVIKMNHPQNAPKDGTMILAVFGGSGGRLVPAAWNPSMEAWVAAQVTQGAFGPDTKYTTFEGRHVTEELLCWIPLPQPTALDIAS